MRLLSGAVGIELALKSADVGSGETGGRGRGEAVMSRPLTRPPDSNEADASIAGGGVAIEFRSAFADAECRIPPLCAPCAGETEIENGETGGAVPVAAAAVGGGKTATERDEPNPRPLFVALSDDLVAEGGLRCMSSAGNPPLILL